jgi:hypothetical protein
LASDHIAATAALAMTIASTNPKKAASVPPRRETAFRNAERDHAGKYSAANTASGTLQLTGYTMQPRNGRTK